MHSSFGPTKTLFHSRVNARNHSLRTSLRVRAEAPGATAPSLPATSKGLVLGPGAPGSWDQACVGNPVVRVFMGDNEERWFMWYSGRGPADTTACDGFAPGSGTVGVAVSDDGLIWRRGADMVAGSRGGPVVAHTDLSVGAILPPNKSDWWWLDTAHLFPSDVQVLSNQSVSQGTGVYWMFYTGASYEGVGGAPDRISAGSSMSEDGLGVEGMKMRPGLAMSQDGFHWARIEGEHHTGALFDVGKPGQWDELFVAGPQVVAHGPRDLRMYYHSFDARADGGKGRFRIGLARSKDGFKWERVGPIFDGGSDSAFDSHGARSASVIREPGTGRYLMFYEGVDEEGRSSIGLAVSKDGLGGWARCPTPVLTAAQEGGAWDAGDVGQPCAVSMAAGRYRLYYSGRTKATGADAPRPWDGIGLALSDAEGAKFEGAPAGYKRAIVAGSK